MNFEEAVKGGFKAKASDIEQFKGYFDYLHNSEPAHNYYKLSSLYNAKKYNLKKTDDSSKFEKAKKNLTQLKEKLIKAKTLFEDGKKQWDNLSTKINYYISCKEFFSDTKTGEFVRLVYEYMFGHSLNIKDATVEMTNASDLEWARCVSTHISNILELFGGYAGLAYRSEYCKKFNLNLLPDFSILDPYLKQMCEAIYKSKWHGPKDTIVLNGVDLDCANVEPALYPLLKALQEDISSDFMRNLVGAIVKTNNEILFVSPVTEVVDGVKHYACNLLALNASTSTDLSNKYKSGTVYWYKGDGTPVKDGSSINLEECSVIGSVDAGFMLGTKGWDVSYDGAVKNAYYDDNYESLLSCWYNVPVLTDYKSEEKTNTEVNVETEVSTADTDTKTNKDVSIFEGIKRIWSEEVYLHTISDTTLLNFTNRLKELIPDWDKLGKATMKDDGTIEITWKDNKVDLQEK